MVYCSLYKLLILEGSIFSSHQEAPYPFYFIPHAAFQALVAAKDYIT